MGEEMKNNSENLLENNYACSNMIFYSQVADVKKPFVGQIFESLNEVHEFYKSYSKEAGFSVRIHKSSRDRSTNEIIRQEYVCFKQGISNVTVSSETKRRRAIVREEYNAKIAVVKVRAETQYVISQFTEEHSHALTTPRRVHMLRCHRNVGDVKKSLAEQFGFVSIPTHQQISFFEMPRDFYNHNRDLRNELAGHDAELLYEYFQSEQTKNESFFYSMDVDSENRMRHCFWADSKSRRAYKYYGDVVVFDTTYNTNRYSMIFAPLIGVNNHGQTILFACAFLSNETTDSFLWLFEQFMKAMPGGPPKVIITDQDQAMTKEISQSFPDTFHRYCICHIMKKSHEKLNAKSDYYDDLVKCIWETETRNCFEAKWKEVIDKNELQNNGWLLSIYDIRERWVSTYVNNFFLASMSSSQRAKSSHAFFKHYVSKENSLLDFIIRFERAVVRQRHLELSADHIDLNERPALKLPILMEKQMAEIYTRTIFYKFQDELWRSFTYVFMVIRDVENQSVYEVYGESSKVRELVYDKTSDYASCSCKKFEFQGIPCRHRLAFFNKEQVRSLPNQYILKRWTIDAKIELVVEDDGIEIKDFGDNSLIMRRTRLFRLASELIDGVLVCEDACEMLLQNFVNVKENIKALVANTSQV